MSFKKYSTEAAINLFEESLFTKFDNYKHFINYLIAAHSDGAVINNLSYFKTISLKYPNFIDKFYNLTNNKNFRYLFTYDTIQWLEKMSSRITRRVRST